MKKLNVLLLIGVLLLGITQTAEAQLLRRLKDKAKEKVVERVEQKVDEKLREIAYKQVDKTWESVFGTSNPSDGGSTNVPFMMNSSVETADKYTFDRMSIMEMTSTDDQGTKETINVEMFYSSNNASTASKYLTGNPEDEQTTFIYDYDRSIMVMLSESEEGKYSFAYDWQQMSSDNSTEEQYIQPGFEQIGSKTIMGIECTGYRNTSETIETEFWVANESIQDYDRAVRANSSTRYFMNGMAMGATNGTILEMTTTNKETNESFEMKTKSIAKSTSKSFDMSDYPVIGNN
ncbi:MAG: DUF4412 domain-containing protein [Balneolaceae bacterium]|nr:DUF4412 domain-containing protein [Balneolaceae bacterium]